MWFGEIQISISILMAGVRQRRSAFKTSIPFEFFGVASGRTATLHRSGDMQVYRLYP